MEGVLPDPEAVADPEPEGPASGPGTRGPTTREKFGMRGGCPPVELREVRFVRAIVVAVNRYPTIVDAGKGSY